MRVGQMLRANRVSRLMFHLTLLVCFLTTSIGTIGCRSGGIPVRSWDEAIVFTQAELNDSGDLESRLEGYARVAADMSAKIDVLDQARPALELIDQLRDVHVPLIGNGWQILLTLLSLVTVDGAKIVAKLEETLGALTRLKSSLDNLDSLPAVVDGIRAFRADPDKHTLADLSSTSAGATPAMRQLHTDLGEVLEPLKDVAGNLGGLLSGLRAASDAGIPIVSDAARQAVEGIDPIEDPLLDLRDGLDRLHQDIAADAEVLERIQEAVRLAREHEE